MRPVSKIISAARAEHYRLTLPWQHGENVRLLTVPMYDQHEAAMLELYEEFQDATRDFLGAYGQPHRRGAGPPGPDVRRVAVPAEVPSGRQVPLQVEHLARCRRVST